MTLERHRLLLVDDHAVVRAGLRDLFHECEDLVVAAEAASGEEAIDALTREPISTVLLDLNLPNRSGLDTLRRIRSHWPTVPVLILSMHPESQYAVALLKAGANGYISKGASSSDLIDATRLVASGRRYVTPAIAELMLDQLNGTSVSAPHERLSTREFEVFLMLAGGSSVGEVAKRLFLSVKTIGTHRANALEKLGLRTNADMTYYAIKHELQTV